MADVPGADDTYPEWLAGGEDGVVATGIDADGGTVLWRSADGRVFDRRTFDEPVADELTDPHLSSEGIVTLGSEQPTAPAPAVERCADVDGRTDRSSTRDECDPARLR